MNIGIIIAVLSLTMLMYVLAILILGIRQQLIIQRFSKNINKTATLYVYQRENKSPNIFTITLKRKFSLLFPLKTFYPGQYITIEIPVEKNKNIRRAYSIASWSKTPYFYQLGIKKEENGIGSSWLYNNLKVGDKIKIHYPKGNFYLKKKKYNDIVLIAGGIGITPLRAMLQAIEKGYLTKKQFRKVYLFYSCRDKSQFCYADEFYLSMQNNSFFNFIPILTGKDDTWQGEIGRLTISKLSKYIDDITQAEYFLCAGTEMMNSLKSELQKNSVNECQIHFENFGVSAPISNDASFKVKFNDSEILFDKSITLLHALEDYGIPVTGDCRAGSCGLCKVHLKKGKVKYLITPELKLNEGEILPCCCIPETDLHLS